MKKNKQYRFFTLFLLFGFYGIAQAKKNEVSLEPQIIRNSVGGAEKAKQDKFRKVDKNKDYLSLDEVIKLAIKRSNQNKENIANLIISKLAVKNAKSAFLPKVNFSTSQKRIQEYSNQLSFNSLDDTRNTFSLRTDWLLFDGLMKETKYSQSKLSTQINKLRINCYTAVF